MIPLSTKLSCVMPFGGRRTSSLVPKNYVYQGRQAGHGSVTACRRILPPTVQNSRNLPIKQLFAQRELAGRRLARRTGRPEWGGFLVLGLTTIAPLNFDKSLVANLSEIEDRQNDNGRYSRKCMPVLI